MKIGIKEANYKMVEVPDNTTMEDVERMISEGEIIVGDTMEADYYVMLPSDNEWKVLF